MQEKTTQKPKRIKLELTLVEAKHLEKAMHYYCLDREILTYSESQSIPVRKILVILRKKMGWTDEMAKNR